MVDLVQWLTACLNEDQRIAEAARDQASARWHHDASYENGYVYDEDGQPVVYDESTPTPEEAAHIAEHDPARVLREITARRRTLAQHKAAVERMDQAMHANDPDAYQRAMTMEIAFRAVLRNDAAVYSKRPGYRDEWRP